MGKGLGLGYVMGKFDGICGLAWDSISVDGLETPFHHLVDNNEVDEQVFAFFLGNSAAGELTIGGTDSAHYSGEITWVPLDVETYWHVQFGGITIGGASMTTSTSAVIDSGTSLIAGNPTDVAAIATKLGATK